MMQYDFITNSTALKFKNVLFQEPPLLCKIETAVYSKSCKDFLKLELSYIYLKQSGGFIFDYYYRFKFPHRK